MKTETLILLVISIVIVFVLVPPVSYLFGKYFWHGLIKARNEENNKKEDCNEKET